MLILLKSTFALSIISYIFHISPVPINETLLSISLGAGVASLPFLIIYSIEHNIERI